MGTYLAENIVGALKKYRIEKKVIYSFFLTETTILMT
jgi:hypothetical protein